MTDRASRASDKFMLRLPDGMRERIKEVADRNKRSMNSEIIDALEARLPMQEYMLGIVGDRFEGADEHEVPEFNNETDPADFPATQGQVEEIIRLLGKLTKQR